MKPMTDIPLNHLFPNTDIHIRTIVEKVAKNIFIVDTGYQNVFLYQFNDLGCWDRLKFQLELQEYLNKKNITVSTPVRFNNGECLFSDGKSVFWASECLANSRGLLRQDLCLASMKSIVKQISKLHKALRDYPSHNVFIPKDFEVFGKELSMSFLSSLVSVKEDVLCMIRTTGKKVLENNDHLRHGDLTYRNLLMIPDSYAFIDFDRTHHGPQIADLYSMIISDPFPETIPENFSEMILYDNIIELYEIYNCEKPLSTKELICGLLEWIFRIIEKCFHWSHNNKQANENSTINLIKIAENLAVEFL